MSSKSFGVPYLYNKSVNGSERVTIFNNILTLNYPCPGEDECSPYVLTLKPGRYLFELWGAQGCGLNTGINCSDGGKGGYSGGNILLKDEETFYIYIGSSGTKSGNGGFNGGGAVGSMMYANCTSNCRAPGGGATDIRLLPGKLESLKSFDFNTTYFGDNESLESRIIVAGGGGGNSEDHGFGGGESGATSEGYSETATSGNQNGPGITHSGVNAGFGYGGYTDTEIYGISGGGGGYYGGGGAREAYGGSGFVNKSYFHIGSTISGDQPFPSPYDINSKETGHYGDGMVRITFYDYKACTVQKINHKYYFMFILIFIMRS